MKSKKIVILFCIFIFSLSVSAKDYSLTKAFVAMDINPDGSIYVTENITFDFQGSFSFAFRDISYGEWKVSNVEVYSEGYKLNHEILNQGNDMRIKWYYSVSDQKKTFTIKYRLEYAIHCYSDICDLNWKMWGAGWDKSLNELEGYVMLPTAVKNSSEIYTWGHPKLTGKIGLLENKKIIYQTFSIPAGQWVEVRVIFPRNVLPSPSFAITKQEAGLQKIVEEEQNYKLPRKEDNFNYNAFIFFILFFGAIFIAILKQISPSLGETLSKFIGNVFLAFLVLVFIIFLITLYTGVSNKEIQYLLFFILLEAVAFFSIWYLFGREPKVDIPSIYERDIPYDYSPAVVDALIHQQTKKPRQETITAELLDLCLKGRLRLKKIAKEKTFGIFGGDEYEIEVLNSSFNQLPNSERILLELTPNSERILLELIVDAAKFHYDGIIFKNKVEDKTPNKVTLTELRNYLMARPTDTQKFFKEWVEAVSEQAKDEKFFSKKTGYLPFTAATLFVIFISFLFYPQIITRLTIIFEAIILLLIFPNALPNRTRKGTEHYIKWMRLNKFLQDFSNLKEMPPDAIALWEKYLVYSIPLGVAHKVQKAMDYVFKDYRGEVHSNIFVGNMSGFSASSFGSSMGSFSSAFSAATSTSGSGGFGGGGGGGGSGGGGGAG